MIYSTTSVGLVLMVLFVCYFRESFAQLADIANSFAAEYNSVYLFDEDTKIE
jgi:hypothetical protein